MYKPDFSKTDGLIPAVVQDYKSNEVLMLAFINEQSWEASLSTGLATFWSRSRQELWVKGATSGHTQKIKQILVDCDEDSIIFKVEQLGGACHKGYRSCFYRQLDEQDLKLISKPVFQPADVYKKGPVK